MEVTFSTKITTTLTLNEKETAWLRNYMQNPLVPSESSTDQEMRSHFWNALLPKPEAAK